MLSASDVGAPDRGGGAANPRWLQTAQTPMEALLAPRSPLVTYDPSTVACCKISSAAVRRVTKRRSKAAAHDVVFPQVRSKNLRLTFVIDFFRGRLQSKHARFFCLLLRTLNAYQYRQCKIPLALGMIALRYWRACEGRDVFDFGSCLAGRKQVRPAIAYNLLVARKKGREVIVLDTNHAPDHSPPSKP